MGKVKIKIDEFIVEITSEDIENSDKNKIIKAY